MKKDSSGGDACRVLCRSNACIIRSSTLSVYHGTEAPKKRKHDNKRSLLAMLASMYVGRHAYTHAHAARAFFFFPRKVVDRDAPPLRSEACVVVILDNHTAWSSLDLNDWPGPGRRTETTMVKAEVAKNVQ